MANGNPQVDWAAMGKSDPNIQEMLDAGVPMTRENYLLSAFDGNVPTNWNEEAEMSIPPELSSSNFSGVGESELPQGPLPIPEGRMGISPAELASTPQVKLGKAGQPPQLEQPPAKRTAPLEPDQPIGEGSRFSQKGWKPPGSQ